jgi:hypothetical protein
MDCGCFCSAKYGDESHAFGLMNSAVCSTLDSIGHLKSISDRRQYSGFCRVPYCIQSRVHFVVCSRY